MAAEATAAAPYVLCPQAVTEQKIKEWRLALPNNLRHRHKDFPCQRCDRQADLRDACHIELLWFRREGDWLPVFGYTPRCYSGELGNRKLYTLLCDGCIDDYVAWCRDAGTEPARI